jgi:hypothetical protein
MTDIFNWTDMLRTNLSHNPHPSMLKDMGYQVHGSYLIKGEVNSDIPPSRKFVFNRDYVLTYIISKIIKPLAITNYESLQEIVKEAWDKYVETSKTN